MKKYFFILTFAMYLHNSIQAMEKGTFLEKTDNPSSIISYTPQIKYDAEYIQKKFIWDTSKQEEEEVKTRLDDLIKTLTLPLNDLFAKYSNIVALFPKDTYTMNLHLEIFMTPTEDDSDFKTDIDYKPFYYQKAELSREEAEQLDKFEHKLQQIIINLSKSLENLFIEYVEILRLFPKESPVLTLDIHFNLAKN